MTRWEQFFLKDKRVEAAPPTQFVRSAATAFAVEGKRAVLDLGCGAGRDTFYLADQRFEVTGADLAGSGLEIARRLSAGRENPPRLLKADARDLPFPAERFDAVYCFGLLHEFTDESTAERDVQSVMSEIARVLPPSGLLALAVLAGDPKEGLPHVRLFTEPMFDDATRGFRPIQTRVCYDLGCTGSANYLVRSGIFCKRST
jgi:SAM-dependent methyltransferase